MERVGKYLVKRTSNEQFRWVLKAANGETILVSETYTTKQNCLAGIASSKKNIEDDKFKRLTSKSNEPYFTQVAVNHQVLGTSEMYSSAQKREQGIQSVKNNAPKATVEDLI